MTVTLIEWYTNKTTMRKGNVTVAALAEACGMEIEYQAQCLTDVTSVI